MKIKIEILVAQISGNLSRLTTFEVDSENEIYQKIKNEIVDKLSLSVGVRNQKIKKKSLTITLKSLEELNFSFLDKDIFNSVKRLNNENKEMHVRVGEF